MDTDALKQKATRGALIRRLHYLRQQREEARIDGERDE
jgi:hypothetical protein